MRWLVPVLVLATSAAALYGAYVASVRPTTVEAKVRSEFWDAPIMVRIAYCESRVRQFNPDGTVHRGRINPKDAGVFQINEPWHLASANRLGMDIYTLDGNIAYARHLYERNGTRDWKWSRRCWGR